MKKHFQDMLWYEMTACVINLLLGVCVVILCSLDLAGILESNNGISMLLLAFMTLAQAIQNWRKNRGIAIFSLCVAAFVVILSILVILGL